MQWSREKNSLGVGVEVRRAEFRPAPQAAQFLLGQDRPVFKTVPFGLNFNFYILLAFKN